MENLTLDWDPQQYHKFADYRLRAGHDLIAQIPMSSYRTIYDLGCGTGELTHLLQKYWHNAKVIGVDSSPAMLAEARKQFPAILWEQHSIADWQPVGSASLIFSNACLHWLPDHQQLLPRLVSYLNPGGVLAIQMPNNFQQPSHTNVLVIAGLGSWRKKLEPLLRRKPVLTAAQYYEILAPITKSVDIWQTSYYHPLTGEDAIVEWVKGSFLKPLLDALSESERHQFLYEYGERIKIAYPKIGEVTLFPFQRLFLIANV